MGLKPLYKSFAAVALVLSALLSAPGANAGSALDTDIRSKIVAAGVPQESLDRILKFIDKNDGEELPTDAYACIGKDGKVEDSASVKYCDEKKREPLTKKLKIEEHRYVVVVDFSKPSTEERFNLIDLKTGEVQKFLTTHGRGSGKSIWAYKFSNIKDSNQSSLGLYYIGESYQGSHGTMLRLYGLERSNDQAYNRDIVIHKAIYARKEFIAQKNPTTKAPWGRLGVSWGCPAVSPETLKIIEPLLKDGAIMDLYQPDLMETALSGHEVKIDPPADKKEDQTATPK
jgi:hypothetical protein